ncbi:crossover junction endodeoxyribonuclease RuvC [Parvularcula sp. IMCC14364]|uniref:crossover junction endodeoxyribonuclease RuvC n=1 Tax=Parvularcula sp. IMCC14364 TaxID=3067902 RepID=UPI002740CC54|nr:crossover junction endodeoxyribonuclease RuvC [Parvularcula sp. IMCC14364]
MSKTIRILGIDPGLRCAGWGLIEVHSGRLGFVASGTIKPDVKQTLAQRLASLCDALQDIVKREAPDMAAVEETFVNSNPRAALTLGQARGVCLAAPAMAGVPVAEYPANTIKKSVVGAGHAGKEQVQAMVRVLLPMSGKQGADAADALAVAICHAHHAAFAHRRSA